MLDSLKARRWRLHGRLHHRLAPLYARSLPTEPDVGLAGETHGSGGAAYVVSPDGLSKRSIVYSFGIGADISFDISLIETYGLTVHAFDPTDQTVRFLETQDFPDSFHFHQLALADRDDAVTLRQLGPTTSPLYHPATVMEVRPGARNGATTVPGLTLETVMSQLGHDWIDVLKLDVEGAEFPLLERLPERSIPAEQVVLELHPHLANLEHHGTMLGATGWRRTRRALVLLRNAGFDLFHVSERGTEFSFKRR